MFKFKANTKFTIISGVVSFVATTKQIKQGIGSHTQFNTALSSALASLESLQLNNIAPIGVSGTWEGINIQIDIIK
jgi:hypothetical protein